MGTFWSSRAVPSVTVKDYTGVQVVGCPHPPDTNPPPWASQVPRIAQEEHGVRRWRTLSRE